jgi:hypothetical protein
MRSTAQLSRHRAGHGLILPSAAQRFLTLRWVNRRGLATVGGPADKFAIRHVGHLGTAGFCRRAGKQSCVPGAQRIGCSTVCDDAKHHGDGDDGHGVTGSRTTQLLQDPGIEKDMSAAWLPDDVASIDEEVDAGHE